MEISAACIILSCFLLADGVLGGIPPDRRKRQLDNKIKADGVLGGIPPDGLTGQLDNKIKADGVLGGNPPDRRKRQLDNKINYNTAEWRYTEQYRNQQGSENSVGQAANNPKGQPTTKYPNQPSSTYQSNYPNEKSRGNYPTGQQNQYPSNQPTWTKGGVNQPATAYPSDQYTGLYHADGTKHVGFVHVDEAAPQSYNSRYPARDYHGDGTKHVAVVHIDEAVPQSYNPRYPATYPATYPAAYPAAYPDRNAYDYSNPPRNGYYVRDDRHG